VSAQIPSTCDVLIIGAGPAGTTAARALAQAGVDVVLADRAAFPRDKICGDGLIGDALGALDALGIRARVLGDAILVDELRLYSPNGESASVRGQLACIPRERLDAIMLDAAIEAGVRFFPSTSATGSVEGSDGVAGARFRHEGTTADVRARVTMLATGANATALGAFGLSVSMKPTGAAGRVYFDTPPDVARRFAHLTIAYQKSWCPGYGWIFPGPSNRLNVGVGLFGSDASGLRRFWDYFQKQFPPAAEIVRTSRQVTEFRGAPMRTGLIGARFGRPGLLVLGDAAAMTYPRTGEGIGKAMESGLMAADFVSQALSGAIPLATVHATYAAEFRRRFQRRYRAYQVAQSCAARPWLVNFLARRANASRFVREQLEGLIDEQGDARDLFSLRGLLMSLVR
jgi:geranylgeranyl reductase family protein